MHTVTLGPLSGQYRIHGPGWPDRWYPRDTERPGKDVALLLDVGRRVKPVLTPDDPTLVLALLRERLTANR